MFLDDFAMDHYFPNPVVAGSNPARDTIFSHKIIVLLYTFRSTPDRFSKKQRCLLWELSHPPYPIDYPDLIPIRNRVSVEMKIHDFQPQSLLSKPTRFIAMEKLTATLCLTLTVLFGSVEMSFSSDSQKNAIALLDLIQRCGLLQIVIT